jgi:hypothetical protein
MAAEGRGRIVAGSITNGARLTAQAWQALRDHRQLLVFPIISGIVVTVATLVFLASLLGTGVVDGATASDDATRQGATILGLVELFLFYLVCSTIVIFCNSALVATVLQLADGRPTSVADGFRAAARRLPTIVVYALISATIGLLANAIARSGRESGNVLVAIVAAIVGALVQGAWTLVVFFAVPVIVAEGLGPVDSLKRSLAIFRGTWGEAFTGQAVIGGISCLVYVAVIVGAGALAGLGLAIGLPALIGLAVVLAIVLLSAIAVLSGAVNGIFQASLYRYATTGDAGPLIDTADAATAFATEVTPATA